jgi:hypothetical protein
VAYQPFERIARFGQDLGIFWKLVAWDAMRPAIRGAVNGFPNKIVAPQFCIVPNGHKSRISLHELRSGRPNG